MRRRSMEYSITSRHPQRNLTFSGSFTFEDHQRFEEILDSMNDTHIQLLALDFAEVSFIDSSGLGMLLLRDRCALPTFAIPIAPAHPPTI